MAKLLRNLLGWEGQGRTCCALGRADARWLPRSESVPLSLAKPVAAALILRDGNARANVGEISGLIACLRASGFGKRDGVSRTQAFGDQPSLARAVQNGPGFFTGPGVVPGGPQQIDIAHRLLLPLARVTPRGRGGLTARRYRCPASS